MIEKIWNNFHSQLLVFITSKMHDSALAEDILQEVFIKVQKNINQLNENDKLKSWLYQICNRTIIDFYRSRETGDHTDDVEKLIATEENYQDLEQINRCIRILIDDLPENIRTILIASELELEKQQVIADRHHLSLPAVKSRIARGRKKLKNKLQACCDFEFNENGPKAHCKSYCGCDD
ncbi:MAG: RNA polymerase sigma factor SigZ [Methylophagaceae bacterium]